LKVRDTQNIIEEIKYLIKNYNLKSTLFRDPLFTFNRERALSLAEQIINNKFKLEWACETRLDLLDEKLIDVMYKSGLRAINSGIESSDRDILLSVKRKPYNNEKVERNIRYCEKKGIKITAFYILGLPEDTEESVKSTIRYAKKLNTFISQFFIFTPFPGTNLYEKIKDLIYEKNWEKFNSFTPVFRHHNLSKERLLELKEHAFISYYFRPAYYLKHDRRLIFSLR
jgi:anaerobic magnesium-protoporphyrin IX monomethyl ester cyclase